MNSRFLLTILTLASLFLAESAQANEGPRAYTIGPGDILDISVWKDPEQSRVVTVLPDGTIALPLIGQFTAEGKTVADLKGEILAKVSRYVSDPVVTLIVQQVGSMRIYVVGKVNRPGQYPMHTNLTVIQALSMAGGLNPFAKKEKIKILRHHGTDTTVIPFNYNNVAEGEELTENIDLQRGDTVVVP